MFCQSCGKEIPDNSAACVFCGQQQNATAQAAFVNRPNGVMYFPKNGKAITSYYLGLFSFLCCVLGIPAIILGILGICHANQHPEAKGKGHAIAGLIMGSITTFGFLFVLLFLIVANS